MCGLRNHLTRQATLEQQPAMAAGTGAGVDGAPPPVVLWRWCRGGRLPAEIPLTGAPPSDVRGMLQVTIRFG